MTGRKRNRIIIAAFLCLFFFTGTEFVLAQNSFIKEVSIGANAGVNLSSIGFNSSKFSVRQTKLPGGVGGVSVRFISEKNFGIQAELNYSQRGWKEHDPDNPDKKYTRALDYLELPIMTHLYFDTGKYTRLVFNFGPQLGYLLGERVLDSNIVFDEDTPPYYSQDAQRKFDWGICFGGGFELRTGIGSFVLDGRYYYGLSDIFNNSRSDDFASSSNQVIGIKLTYFYTIKKF